MPFPNPLCSHRTLSLGNYTWISLQCDWTMSSLSLAQRASFELANTGTVLRDMHMAAGLKSTIFLHFLTATGLTHFSCPGVELLLADLTFQVR
jgi:hypothetical protein